MKSYDDKSGLREKDCSLSGQRDFPRGIVQVGGRRFDRGRLSRKDGRELLGVLSDLTAGRTSGYLSQIESYQAMLHELGFRMETRLVAA